jgi:hypothetical protein
MTTTMNILTECDTNVINTDNNQPVASKKGHGKGVDGHSSPNLGDEEVVMVTVAFINASENPEVGSGQKASTFDASIQEKYKLVVIAQVKAVHYSLKGIAINNNDINPWEFYYEHTGLAVKMHFKEVIAPAVLSFLQIEAQNPHTSGEGDDQLKNRLCQIYSERKGKEFEPHYHRCVQFLREKPKWQPFDEEAGRKGATTNQKNEIINSKS